MNPAPARRIRRTARVVLLDANGRVLLFRYLAKGYPPFWILAGGECEAGEDYPAAARRELREETGIDAAPLAMRHVREADYDYAGEPVHAIEHFFHHRVEAPQIDTSGHTEVEREAMREYRWFTCAEISGWAEAIYPVDLPHLIAQIAESQREPTA